MMSEPLGMQACLLGQVGNMGFESMAVLSGFGSCCGLVNVAARCILKSLSPVGLPIGVEWKLRRGDKFVDHQMGRLDRQRLRASCGATRQPRRKLGREKEDGEAIFRHQM